MTKKAGKKRPKKRREKRAKQFHILHPDRQQQQNRAEWSGGNTQTRGSREQEGEREKIIEYQMDKKKKPLLSVQIPNRVCMYFPTSFVLFFFPSLGFIQEAVGEGWQGVVGSVEHPQEPPSLVEARREEPSGKKKKAEAEEERGVDQMKKRKAVAAAAAAVVAGIAFAVAYMEEKRRTQVGTRWRKKGYGRGKNWTK